MDIIYWSGDRVKGEDGGRYISQLQGSLFRVINPFAGARLVEKVFVSPDGKPSKWWTCFAKKRFMEKSLTGFGMS